MADETRKKTSVEHAREIASQLQEIHQNAKNNVEKLAAIWLTAEENVNIDGVAEKLDHLLKQQNDFQEALEETVSSIDMECNRIENETEQ